MVVDNNFFIDDSFAKENSVAAVLFCLVKKDRKYMRAGEYFYRTQAWKDCRTAYKKSVGGLCERCMNDNIVSAGEIVHHKIHITNENIDDPSILLDWNNLELLCRKCHANEHPEVYGKSQKRYKVDIWGRVETV